MSYCLGECRVFLTLPETFVSDTSNHVLLVAGSVLDALELCSTIDDNLHDADRKIGKKTYSSAAEISGSWAGSALGAKGGAGPVLQSALLFFREWELLLAVLPVAWFLEFGVSFGTIYPS